MIFPTYHTLRLTLALTLFTGCYTATCPPSGQGGRSVYRGIKSVGIVQQAKAATGTSPEVCDSFRLTEAQVQQFFAIADEKDVRTYASDLDYAPCSVEGTLRLENGLAGKWEIEMSGRGRIVFDDDHIVLLYCSNCSGPFAR
jgi:hypothetical protein